MMEAADSTAMVLVPSAVGNELGLDEVNLTNENSVAVTAAGDKASAKSASCDPVTGEGSFCTEETGGGLSTAMAAMVTALEQPERQEPETMTVTQSYDETVTMAAGTLMPSIDQLEQELTSAEAATEIEAAAESIVLDHKKDKKNIEHAPVEGTLTGDPPVAGESSAETMDSLTKAPEASVQQPILSTGWKKGGKKSESTGGGNWMTGLMSSIGFGDGNSTDKSSAMSTEEERAAGRGTGEVIPATEPMVNAEFPTEETGGAGNGDMSCSEMRKAEEMIGTEDTVGVTNDAVKESTMEAGLPDEVEGGGVGETNAEADRTAVDTIDKIPTDGTDVNPKEAIAAEMKAFLEESDDEGFGEGEGVVSAGTLLPGGDASSVLEPIVVETSTQQHLSSPDSNEFSATHAKKVIGTGVVLQRKNSITSIAAELKNKSDFSSEDAAASIAKGAISERTRRLQAEQEALKKKHAKDRQYTEFPDLHGDLARQGSVKGKAMMYHQAIQEIHGEKTGKSASLARRLSGDWTSRRDSLEQFVVKYDPPPTPASSSTVTAGPDGPTRYIPFSSKTATVPTPRSGGGVGRYSAAAGRGNGDASQGSRVGEAAPSSTMKGRGFDTNVGTRGHDSPIKEVEGSNRIGAKETSGDATAERAAGKKGHEAGGGGDSTHPDEKPSVVLSATGVAPDTKGGNGTSQEDISASQTHTGQPIETSRSPTFKITKQCCIVS